MPLGNYTRSSRVFKILGSFSEDLVAGYGNGLRCHGVQTYGCRAWELRFWSV